VRELEHVILRAALRAGREKAVVITLEPEHLGLEPTSPPAADAPPSPSPAPTLPALPLRDAVDAFTRRAILDAVAAAGGNWAEAARRLGTSRANLHRIGARLGVRG
jgi:anaerobic nitric oxide reductase transcription regulator